MPASTASAGATGSLCAISTLATSARSANSARSAKGNEKEQPIAIVGPEVAKHRAGDEENPRTSPPRPAAAAAWDRPGRRARCRARRAARRSLASTSSARSRSRPIAPWGSPVSSETLARTFQVVSNVAASRRKRRCSAGTSKGSKPARKKTCRLKTIYPPVPPLVCNNRAGASTQWAELRNRDTGRDFRGRSQAPRHSHRPDGGRKSIRYEIRARSKFSACSGARPGRAYKICR